MYTVMNDGDLYFKIDLSFFQTIFIIGHVLKKSKKKTIRNRSDYTSQLIYLHDM